MTPEQAAAAGVVLGAKLVIPIHYGVSGADSYEELANAEAAFIEIAKKRNLPVEILKPGEWAKWKANA
jgi:L-ascorbate metabolism protein UlaG (beta-lactamase superfamily)